MFNYKLKINDNKSSRVIDDNGYMVVKKTPIAKAGVFEYLASELDIKNKKPDDIVKVYRSFEELEGSASQFNGMPITLTHKWVEGVDNPTIVGTVTNVVASEPYLFGDTTFIDKNAQGAIESGEYKQFSPGYTADCVEESGTYNGEDYEYVQKNIVYNHLALVDIGRSGADVRVLDENSIKKTIGGITMSLKGLFGTKKKIADENKVTQDDSVDKRKLLEELTAIAMKADSEFDGGAEEKARTIEALAEKLSYDQSEDETRTTDEEPVVEEEVKVEDMDIEALAKAVAKLLSEQGEEPEVKEEVKVSTEDEDSEEKENMAMKVEDRKAIEDKAIQRIRAEDAKSRLAYNDVSKVAGSFNMYNAKGDLLSPSEIYAYGIECLTGEKSRFADNKTAFEAMVSVKVLDNAEPIVEDKNMSSAIDGFSDRVRR